MVMVAPGTGTTAWSTTRPRMPPVVAETSSVGASSDLAFWGAWLAQPAKAAPPTSRTARSRYCPRTPTRPSRGPKRLAVGPWGQREGGGRGARRRRRRPPAGPRGADIARARRPEPAEDRKGLPSVPWANGRAAGAAPGGRGGGLAQAIGVTVAVQDGQRLASLGMEVVHSGQGRVVAVACGFLRFMALMPLMSRKTARATMRNVRMLLTNLP